MLNQAISSLNPYLAFPGTCREAMEFYAEALDGKLEFQTFKEAPTEIPEDYKDKIMHARLTFGNAVIMASDGMPDHPVNMGDNNVSLSIAASDLEEARRFFKNLSEGGTITMPMSKTFWGAEFGMCIDKFGVSWMVNYEFEKNG